MGVPEVEGHNAKHMSASEQRMFLFKTFLMLENETCQCEFSF